MPAMMRSVLLAMLTVLTSGCSSQEGEMTIYPFSFDDAATQDALRRYEADYRVKAGTGSYRAYSFNGFNSDCVMVVPQKGTREGIRHASHDDVDAIYCYDQDTGQFRFRL